jgi:hypothetical protein
MNRVVSPERKRERGEWLKPLWSGYLPASIRSGSLEPIRQAIRVTPEVQRNEWETEANERGGWLVSYLLQTTNNTRSQLLVILFSTPLPAKLGLSWESYSFF